MSNTGFPKTLTVLTVLIGVCSSGAAIAGIWPDSQGDMRSIVSVFGENVALYGQGLYRHDSVSVAEQAVGQDYVTLLISVPLLWCSLLLARRGLLKGQLLLAGTYGYFLYTYASYSFFSMYNAFFLVYVAILSMSLFGFVLSWSAVNIRRLDPSSQPSFPAKRTAGFLLFAATAVALMWAGRIVPSIRLSPDNPPEGLEHYTTLVIQALDLGVVVPAAVVGAVMLLRRKAVGYLLSSVLVLKECTMLTSISAMLLRMRMAGVEVSVVELLLFPGMNAAVIYLLVTMLAKLREPKDSRGMPS